MRRDFEAGLYNKLCQLAYADVFTEVGRMAVKAEVALSDGDTVEADVVFERCANALSHISVPF